MRRLVPTLALAALLLGTPAVGHAASFDPDLTWRTMETPHFRITFHGGLEQIAEETALVAEDIWAEMTEELQHDPARKTEVVLVDNTDSANGYAMTMPVNTIVIYVTAPAEGSTLDNYEDWNDAILTHEYTHILHIDTVEGVGRLLRKVFGRIVSTNRISPGWVVEGHATLQETRHTPGGRGRSTLVDMIKRMSVLEDAFPPLGNLDGYQTAWPGGNLRYLFGQDFQQFVADTKGEQVWTDFFHTYGGSVPWFLPERHVFGERLLPLYRDWRSHLEVRYGAQRARVEADGLTEFRLLSDGVDACAAPTFSPDGRRIVWACSDPATGSRVTVANGDGTHPQTVMDQRFGSDFAWRADSEAFAFSSLHVVDRFNAYYDVYLWTMGEGLSTLTNGERARNPAFSPDGRELLVVKNRAQNNDLARITVDGSVTPLTQHTDHTQLSTPRFSPDGRHVAVSLWRGGQRDIWVLDPNGTPVRRVTADLANEQDPWWSPDGQRLYFSSDRTGIYNIYAVDLETERLWQVTNVLGGAFGPSVNADESQLVFESYSATGFDIAMMPLDPGAWIDRGRLSRPLGAGTPLAATLPGPTFQPVTPGTWDDAPPEAEADAPWWRFWTPPSDRQRTMTPAAAALIDPFPRPGLDGIGAPMGPFGAEHGRPALPGQGEFAPDTPDGGVDVDDPSRTEVEAPEEQDYDFTHPVGRYDPLPSLLPPRYVVPFGSFTALGLRGGLSTGGTDVMRHWSYGASVGQRLVRDESDPTRTYRTSLGFTEWSAGVAYNRRVPVFSIGLSRYNTPYGSVYVATAPDAGGGAWIPSIEATTLRYWDRRLSATAQVSYPLTQYQSVFGRWSGLSRSPLEALPAGTYEPFLPSRGFFSSIGGGWTHVRGRSYSRSISPEESRVLILSGQLTHPWLGASQKVIDASGAEIDAPFTRLQGTAEWRQYETAPWAENHVIAWKLAGGASIGDQFRYGSFRLGGDFGESASLSLPDEWRALRGFPAATVSGDWYYLGSVEYRLPLWIIDRGVGMVPAFARNISAAVYLDAGNAFASATDAQGALPGTLMGTGAELQGRAILGWAVPLTIRLGYGFALRGPGYPIGDAQGLYAWLGSSF